MIIKSKKRRRQFVIVKMPVYSILILFIFLNSAHLLAQEEEDAENLNVFWKWVRWNNPGSFLIDHYLKQADELYEIRDKEIAKLKTKEDWQKRQIWIKEKLSDLIGPFPQKTPLNPRITGVIQKNGFRVEKLVYESMPGFYVTGCVFIPDHIKGKAPAILNVIGHNQIAFRADLYQLVYLNLVKKGFIVLAIDPIGQGEAVQFYDPEIGFSKVGYTVVEHCYAGNLTFLSGTSLARYFTWDGIRGIDYLISRDDVDPDRIGVTGFSGGGTVTSFITAMDDRVRVSVPCSWSTSSRRQTETKGTQDAESFFYHGLKKGITFEDLLEVRAPVPTLMTFTSRDQYLSIQGAREAYKEINKVYKAFGKEENIQLVEDDYKHWLTPKIRQSIYAFFMKHMNVSGDPAEEEIDLLSEEELQVTPTGQVSTWLETENIQSINAKESAPLLEKLDHSRQSISTHIEKVKEKAIELSGYIQPEFSDGSPFFNGRYQRDGYSVGKYAIKGEGDYVIPLLLFVPDLGKSTYPAVIYLHPEGKAAEAGPGGEIEKLVRRGYIVAAADVLGIGEVKNTATREGADDYTGVLIGRSTPGIQAGDITRVVYYLHHLDQAGAEIGAVGIDEMCIPLLHAAAFEPKINNITLVGSPISYRSIVVNDLYKIGLVFNDDGYWHPWEIDFSWGVAGALTAYDLPDLIGCLVPRKVVLSAIKNQLLEPASDKVIDLDMAFPANVYTLKGVSKNLKITSSVTDLVPLVDWSFE
jgi:cephalosporin-C deacetylase-like acetyl esterase